MNLVGNAGLFAKDGDLVPVGRRPIIELDHVAALPWYLWFG
jgi:hypothetical protein